MLRLTGEVDPADVDNITADPAHQPVPVAGIDAGAAYIAARSTRERPRPVC